MNLSSSTLQRLGVSRIWAGSKMTLKNLGKPDGEGVVFKNDINHNSTVIKEEEKYSRYLRVSNRIVNHTFSNNEEKVVKKIEYDIVGSPNHSGLFVAVVPFHSNSKQFTVLAEYAQGANSFLYGVPCGGFSDKHQSLENCVEMELSEEAYLKSGRLVKLIPDSHPGILEVKWCSNRFIPYLVIDPEEDDSPCPRDYEEFITLEKIGVEDLKKLMFSGEMLLPSFVSCSLALEYLAKNDYFGFSREPGLFQNGESFTATPTINQGSQRSECF